MRIALCLSGLPREVEDTFPYLKRTLLDRYNIDVFAHTWLEDPWNHNDETYMEPNTDYTLRLAGIDKILQLYKPKSFSLDQYHIRQAYYQSNEKYKLTTRYCSMLESVYIANELKKRYEQQNDFKYDCVIRCRYDLGLIENFDFKSYDLNNNIYVKRVDKPVITHINDAFAFSSSEKMDKWCDLYNNISEMAEMVVFEYPSLADMYKQNHKGPDAHDLYAAWNRKHKLGVVDINFENVHWRVGGYKHYDEKI